jgi:hypothetical protein
MIERSVLVAGFPESGKTTFLAALWHLVTSAEVETELKLASLRHGEFTHLNALAQRWRDALPQERTLAGSGRVVSMNLTSDDAGSLRLTFPDLSGEDYREMWETRNCTLEFATTIRDTSSVLLFVHADRIVEPRWLIDDIVLAAAMGGTANGEKAGAESEPTEWTPRVAPSQVQLVDLLQLLSEVPLDVGPRRLVVVLSAWDRVAPEGLTPSAFLKQRLPLLSQFLNTHLEQWQWDVFGVSAQGGDLSTSVEADKKRVEGEVERLRSLDNPSERICVVGENSNSHDLTTLLSWLIA